MNSNKFSCGYNRCIIKLQGRFNLIECYRIRASEGKTVEVPYRGDAEATVLDILGGLRSACTYTGASRLKELPKRTTFIRCSQQTNEIFSAFAAGGD